MKTNNPLIKFCGLRRLHEIKVADTLCVDFIGLMFAKKSPRYITQAQALILNREIQKRGMLSVGVFVEPSYAQLVEVLTHVPLDFVQLHGKETKEYCKEIFLALSYYGCGVIKACGVRSVSDFEQAKTYENVCSFLLLDAKPPVHDERTGGHGVAFDWKLLSSFHPKKPYFLAGGIHTNNIFQIPQRQRMLLALDVSSGIEYAKTSQRSYQKSPHKMQQFVRKMKKVYQKI